MLIRPVMSPLKTFSVTQAVYDNVPLDPVVTIPTSDTTKYGRTIALDDLPTYSFPPESVKYIEKSSVYGYNGSGAAVTIYWKMYMTPSGGSEELVASGNLSVGSATPYFTVDCNFLDVSVGDYCAVSIWGSSSTGVTIDGYQGHISPTRLMPETGSMANVTEIYTYETVSSGSVISTGSRIYKGLCDAGLSTSPQTITPAVTSFESNTSYGMYRYGKGDYTSADTGVITPNNTKSYHPRITNSQILTSVTYRKLLL